MRILCVIDSLGSGGAQRQLVELGLGFKEKGHTVSFLVYYNIPFYSQILENAGIIITCINEPIYIKRILKMRHFIRRGKYDAVLSFLEGANFICEIAGIPFRKWKLVVGERSANPAILKSIKLKLYRWFHVFADYVVANSYSNLQIIRSVNFLLPESKCKVIYNLIDFNIWKSINNHIYRKEKKIKIVIGANHNYNKNSNGLIEALALMDKEERDKILIYWYGDKVTKPFLNNSILTANEKISTYDLENVISFYPATHDITKIIQESDTVGLFSFYEGFPNIVIEGMACAKPVICSAVSDLPKILSHDNNLLCDPSEPQSIRKAISYLINLNNDQLTQIGLGNERIAKQMFNREKSLLDYLQLLNK